MQHVKRRDHHQRALLVIGALGAAFGLVAISHDAGAQTVRDHRTGGTGEGRQTPSPPPPPASNTAPPVPPGEFALQNVVSKQFLSAANGALRMSATRGPSEKFRITQERATSFKRIVSPANTYVHATTGTTRLPASLVGTTNDGTLFDLVRRRGVDTYAYEIALKSSPTWFLQQDADPSGLKATLSAWNVTSNARALFWITKCGDIGSGHEYALRPLGAATGSPPVRIMRHTDGTFTIGVINERKYWSATGGGGNAPGKGSDGYPIAYKDTIGADEKFKIIDQGNCTYAIQTPKGWYFGMKAGAWSWATLSTRISDPNAAASIGYVAYWELIPTTL